MQAIEHIEINTDTTPQVRALIRTILDAATALARLLPNEELEQRFEFAWGHQIFGLLEFFVKRLLNFSRFLPPFGFLSLV